jgi:hypothetical protein
VADIILQPVTAALHDARITGMTLAMNIRTPIDARGWASDRNFRRVVTRTNGTPMKDVRIQLEVELILD